MANVLPVFRLERQLCPSPNRTSRADFNIQGSSQSRDVFGCHGAYHGTHFFKYHDGTRTRPCASISVGSPSHPSCRRGSLSESCSVTDRAAHDLEVHRPPALGRVADSLLAPAWDSQFSFHLRSIPWVGTRSASGPAH